VYRMPKYNKKTQPAQSESAAFLFSGKIIYTTSIASP
jgi:hypothetical protein